MYFEALGTPVFLACLGLGCTGLLFWPWIRLLSCQLLSSDITLGTGSEVLQLYPRPRQVPCRRRDPTETHELRLQRLAHNVQLQQRKRTRTPITCPTSSRVAVTSLDVLDARTTTIECRVQRFPSIPEFIHIQARRLRQACQRCCAIMHGRMQRRGWRKTRTQ